MSRRVLCRIICRSSTGAGYGPARDLNSGGGRVSREGGPAGEFDLLWDACFRASFGLNVIRRGGGTIAGLGTKVTLPGKQCETETMGP